MHSIKITLCAALLFLSAAAHGHRFHAGITDISMNPRTGNTEIVHTYMAHDVEALLENLYQRQFDLGDEDDLALFRRYLEKQFQIKDAQGRDIPLTWVGLKTDAERVTVYQEIVKANLPESATILQATLTDFLADQINTININRNNTPRPQTLQFSRQQREHTLERH
ncbi:MAG: hypothetical protein HY253_08950 [Burkholderiales bacterium]|nr:hypothetical protein [Burkholderiales bacterium]